MLPSKNECTGCGNCILACQHNAISFQKDSYDNIYTSIDQDKCKECGRCVRVCPQIKCYANHKPIKAYVGWSKDSRIRKKAASGGIASALSLHFLQMPSGVANGVIIKEDHEAHHIIIDEADIEKSCSSKYTFSYMDNVVKDIAQALKANSKCIFIGLPCQCAAVINWCDASGVDISGLFVVDIACHGVPSGDYLKQHIELIERKHKVTAREVSFRDHDVGTKKAFVFTLRDDRGDICYKKAVWNDDNYQIAYHSALMYRDNCYSCKYACENRVGDLSLADAFWMKNENENQKDYFRGAGCILANTQKGIDLLALMSSNDEIVTNEIGRGKALQLVTQFHQPSVLPELRDSFMNEYMKTRVFDEACNRMLRKERLKRKLFSWIKPNIAALIRNEWKLGNID